MEDHQFRTAQDDSGFTLTRDPAMHRRLMREAERRLRDNREWLIPNSENDEHPNGIVADHVSDDMGCLRKAVLNKEALQKEFDLYGEPPLDKLTDRDVVFFGNGYAWQWNILGLNTEANTWNKEAKFWHSADGVLDSTFVEAKQTRRSALKKADREAGLSVEDVILRDNTNWWNHMLVNMKLYGHRTHYLSIHWINPGDSETFRIDASDEAVDAKWDWLAKRRDLRREFERINTLPGIEYRTSPTNCTYCTFRTQPPCLTEVPLLDGSLP